MADLTVYPAAPACVYSSGYEGQVSVGGLLNSTATGGDIAIYVYPGQPPSGPPVDVETFPITQGVPWSWVCPTLLYDGPWTIMVEYDSIQYFREFDVTCYDGGIHDPPSAGTWTLSQSQACAAGAGTITVEVTRDSAGTDAVTLELVELGLIQGGVVDFGTPETFTFTEVPDGSYTVDFADGFGNAETLSFTIACSDAPPPEGSQCDPFRFTHRWTKLGPLLFTDRAEAVDLLERHDQELEQHFVDCGCQDFEYTYRWATFHDYLIDQGTDRAIDVMEQRDLELEEAVAHDPGCELQLTHRWPRIIEIIQAGDFDAAWTILDERDREIEEARSGCSCGCASMTFTATTVDFLGFTASVDPVPAAATLSSWTVSGEFVDDGMGPWSVVIEVSVNSVLQDTWTFGPFASATFGPTLVDVGDVAIAPGDLLSLTMVTGTSDLVSFEMTTDYDGCVDEVFTAPS